ncbi:MAG TPA: ferredoxin--NADP reductase [Rhodocyclaceae bacterium]|nr:ferredoxin--NADP reductase [Rhodocyclaceae bacterium]
MPTDTKWRAEQVIWIRHWTPTLISFRTTRAEAFRFVPGHYARLGMVDTLGNAIWRPFSMVSAADDDFLEFLLVLVPGGDFSARLAALKVGDAIMVEKLSYGFLTVNQLAPGNDLWMLSSGTGLGPFMSILRDPDSWRSFDHLILVHSVRRAEELAYRQDIEAMRDSAAATGARADLRYIPIVTREQEPGMLHARIPQLIIDGRLEGAADVPLEVRHSRAMVCGNPELARDMRSLLTARGFVTSRRGALGQMAFEKYW